MYGLVFRSNRRCDRGFSLTELLVTIGLLATVAALLLPAVQGSRELARRGQCQSQLRDVAAAFALHESALGHLPAGGWGYRWSPDADRGSGAGQPGTWTYNILPFLEQVALHGLSSDHLPEEISVHQRIESARQIATPVSSYLCPSRGRSGVQSLKTEFYNTQSAASVAQADYAACAGGQFQRVDSIPMEQAMSGRWRPARDSGGICFQRSLVRVGQIVDGSSKTYLVGEKSLDAIGYESITVSEPYGMWCYDWGAVRTASEIELPTRDQTGTSGGAAAGAFRFGSAHPGTFQMAFCDGSVHAIDYDIDGSIHAANGIRHDRR